jgi:hypothetical protein
MRTLKALFAVVLLLIVFFGSPGPLYAGEDKPPRVDITEPGSGVDRPAPRPPEIPDAQAKSTAPAATIQKFCESLKKAGQTPEFCK